MTNVLTWAIGYANGNTNELFDHQDKLPEVWIEFFDEIYCEVNNYIRIVRKNEE